MVKIAKLSLLIFLGYSILFGANNYINELKSYDRKIETSSKDELLRVYHSLKSIYIHSIVTNDDTLKKEVLKRLVTSSKELSLDAIHYEKELQTLLKQKAVKKTSVKTLPKKVISKPKKKEVKKASKTIKSSNYLKSLIKKDTFIYLEFLEKLSNKDIKYFKLKTKNAIKEVYDIKGILQKNYTVKTPNGLQALKIAQYNKETIRVVIQRADNKLSSKKIAGNKLRIYFNLSITKNSKKTIVKKPSSSHIKSIAKNKTIVIDAGHGGRDGGAVGYKKKVEKKAVLQIALTIGKELKKRGYKVYYTRTKDKFIKLRSRTKIANDKNADIFLSIHANAAAKKSQYLSRKGLETYFLSPARSKRSKNIAALENKSDIEEMNYFSKQTFLNVFNREKIIAANKLALDIQQGMLDNLRKSYKVTDGGVREAPFWVLVGAQMPSILIEIGYITNPTEATRMFNVKYQKRLAVGIANGLDNYFIKNEF